MVCGEGETVLERPKGWVEEYNMMKERPDPFLQALMHVEGTRYEQPKNCGVER